LSDGARVKYFQLNADQPDFVGVDAADPISAHDPCRGASDGLLTYDLRL